MEGSTMVKERKTAAARGTQKATTFTEADARRLEIYARQQERSVAWLLHRAMVRELDAAGVEDDGQREK